MVSRCDCIVLAVVGQFFKGGTVVHAVTSGTAEHSAADCFLYGCWWDYRSYVFGRTNLRGFKV